MSGIPYSEYDLNYKYDLSTKWKREIEKRMTRLGTILERVKRKSEEMESLRDGVRLYYAPECNKMLTKSTAV